MAKQPDEQDVATVASALKRLVGEAGGVDKLIVPKGYRHFGLTLLDANLSLRLSYDSAVRRLHTYCDNVDGLDWNALDRGPEYGTSRLINDLESMTDDVSDKVFGRLKAPGTQRPRREVILELARNMRAMDPPIETQADFVSALNLNSDAVEKQFLKVKGVGVAAWRYTLTLNRLPAAKPDTMVIRWVRGTLGERAGHYRAAKAIGNLFEAAVTQLQSELPDLDIRVADHLVWRKASNRPISADAATT